MVVGGLPGSLHAPFPVRERRVIDSVFVTATCGARLVGETAPEIEHLISTSPNAAAGGRRLPGVPWTFLVPSSPAVVGGRAVVYRMHPDATVVPATRGRWDDRVISVAVCGTYTSRHDDGLPTRDVELDRTAGVALEELVLDYLLPRFALPTSQVRGPWDAGDAAEAGDALELWVRRLRGERLADPSARAPYDGPLSAWDDRLAALERLGCGVSDGGTPQSVGAAVAAVCRRAGAPVCHRWSPDAERVVRRALADLAAGAWPLLPSPHGTHRGE